MTTTLRQPTTETLGLPSVLGFFRTGHLPVDAASLVHRIFGHEPERGCLVVSGANGIVGAGKCMQLGARLHPFGVRIAALDLPGVPDGLGAKFPGLVAAFGRERAAAIMENIVRFTYDGRSLPDGLGGLRPRALLEAIPEVLSIKRAHYRLFRESYPDIIIHSVTSGFPSAELGEDIAHPAFPHEINKVWEMVEKEPSDWTRLMWALGMIPMPVGDHWSFVLDVLFCGLTLAALNHCAASNMPYWKIDKWIRSILGPNPFRAHDAIGAKGADTLTWSCLYHLAQRYGPLFDPGEELTRRKESGQPWYPLSHLRPIVDWNLSSEEIERLETDILGALYQMTCLMVYENRAHLSFMNSIGELCAQLTRGILARMRSDGASQVIRAVERFHAAHPEAATSPWRPEVLARMDSPEWRQLYVNAEHDGTVGVITLGRESYNRDVDDELNRAIDWLKAAGIERVILTGDFHLTTQLVGADTSEFYPALADSDAGFRIAANWSRTARRLYDDFRVSVGFIHGKRCLGGMLELMMHCHYLVTTPGARLGMPEVTLPVVPGMEGCHWPFRRCPEGMRTRPWEMLLTGEPLRAAEAEGWLIDAALPLDAALQLAWNLASGKDGRPARPLEAGSMSLPDPGGPAPHASTEAVQAIVTCARASSGAPLSEALEIQARHSGGFMVSDACRKGAVGRSASRALSVSPG